MIGLGTAINVVLILIGGILGFFFGKLINDEFQTSMIRTCGVATLFIGMGGAFEVMFTCKDGIISSGRGTFIVIILLLGTLIGEVINIEKWFEKFGEWLKIKSGNAKDPKFVDGFLTATFTVCIGAMTIVGSLQDGIYGDFTTLAIKGMLDMIIVMVMTSSMGKGPVFSVIPVFVIQGLITLLARFIEPVLTESSLSNLSMIGSILIFCVGVNLVWDKRVRVANMLPAVFLAVGAAFLPWQF